MPDDRMIEEEFPGRYCVIADLIDKALDKKGLGKFVNYGEMLEAKNLLAQASRLARAGELAEADSGIRYCIAHHGIIEQDATVCDFKEDDDEGECVSRPLLYSMEAT